MTINQLSINFLDSHRMLLKFVLLSMVQLRLEVYAFRPFWTFKEFSMLKGGMTGQEFSIFSCP